MHKVENLRLSRISGQDLDFVYLCVRVCVDYILSNPFMINFEYYMHLI